MSFNINLTKIPQKYKFLHLIVKKTNSNINEQKKRSRTSTMFDERPLKVYEHPRTTTTVGELSDFQVPNGKNSNLKN